MVILETIDEGFFLLSNAKKLRLINKVRKALTQRTRETKARAFPATTKAAMLNCVCALATALWRSAECFVSGCISLWPARPRIQKIWPPIVRLLDAIGAHQLHSVLTLHGGKYAHATYMPHTASSSVFAAFSKTKQ